MSITFEGRPHSKVDQFCSATTFVGPPHSKLDHTQTSLEPPKPPEAPPRRIAALLALLSDTIFRLKSLRKSNSPTKPSA